MARLRDRNFAGKGAFLFLGSASALTIFVIMNPGADSTAPKTSQQQTCTDTQTEPSLPVPDIYKPDGAVTDLQKTDLSEGSGPAAKAGDCLIMKYYGTLASDGTKFDENFTDTTAFAFKLGQGAVIQGWDQGVPGMKAGGMRRLVIPAALGYGDQGQGSIPANSDLVFVIKLLRIQN
jgi:peptidylprolyl isomerase